MTILFIWCKLTILLFTFSPNISFFYYLVKSSCCAARDDLVLLIMTAYKRGFFQAEGIHM